MPWTSLQSPAEFAHGLCGELLVPVLDSRPQLLHGNPGLAAIVDGEVLIGHGIRMANLARRFDGIEEQL